MYKLLDIL